ncbi:MAG: histidinol dehydrogenase [Bacteroidales bacterium]|jgi:histidinol dehydrogenase|nr:histidinol dehydrogenase [Bacteroidales bacterium]
MNIISYPARETWDSLCRRPAFDHTDLDNVVASVFQKVKNEGDKALFELSEKYDGAVFKNLRVPGSAIESAIKSVPTDLREAISIAGDNIAKFHRAQLFDEDVVETTPGVKCWRKKVAIDSVGLYIPGGTAPLFSTVLMLAIPAAIAGCRRVIICTPPDRNGNVNPLILYAAHYAGVNELYRVGGAQAIAAMVFGTETIPKVDKIFGPGNQYVTRAKEMAQLEGTPIDMPAGPSEVLVIAGSDADPSFVAADLLSQAEHGSDSQVILLSDNNDLLESAMKETEKQARQLPRKNIALMSLENSRFILLRTLDECMEFSNIYAPEHLIISTSDPHLLADKVRNAGSVFIGRYSCESAGDYASGTNHTLPTGGFAKSMGGVSAESFVKKITFQEISGMGMKSIGPAIEKMADAELLQGHKNAVTLRLKTLKNG